MTAEAVTDIDESRLSRWLFGTHHRIILWRELKFPVPAKIRFELDPPEVPERIRAPGDIDVLICDPSKPREAVALECKLLKVKPETFETLQPGKLQKLREGARQANGLWALGFHQSYLLVCVKIDGRQQEGNFLSRGLSGPLVKVIYDVVGRLDVRPEVGLAVVEITQPVDKKIEDTGGIGLRVVRRPTRQIQTDSVTAWVDCAIRTKSPQDHGPGL